MKHISTEKRMHITNEHNRYVQESVCVCVQMCGRTVCVCVCVCLCHVQRTSFPVSCKHCTFSFTFSTANHGWSVEVVTHLLEVVNEELGVKPLQGPTWGQHNSTILTIQFNPANGLGIPCSNMCQACVKHVKSCRTSTSTDVKTCQVFKVFKVSKVSKVLVQGSSCSPHSWSASHPHDSHKPVWSTWCCSHQSWIVLVTLSW